MTDFDEQVESFDYEGDTLGDALDELAALVNPHTTRGKLYFDVYYLLLLWASIGIYQVEPMVEAGKEEAVKIIPLENGWKIFDYGYYLMSSPGENYGTYCTGKLIETTQEIINLLAKRGATRVGALGNSIAKRAAWMQCEDLGIQVDNFYPAESDLLQLQRIRKLRAEAKQRRALAAEEVRRPV